MNIITVKFIIILLNLLVIAFNLSFVLKMIKRNLSQLTFEEATHLIFQDSENFKMIEKENWV